MTPLDKDTPETTRRQEFQHSLQLLDGIASWHLWTSVFTILLLPAAIILISLSVRLVFDQPGGIEASWLVRGLLGIVWAMTGITLFQQRRRLQLFRQGLIDQMDAATKQRVKAEKFYGLSIMDPLTGLYNRRLGEARLEEEIARAEESKDPLILLAIDFDKFKQINDQHGHAAGDAALKEFSRRLQRAIRACDVAIRVGGDEFLVILPDCPPDKIQSVFSRMGSIEASLDGKKIPVSFSHGMAQYQVNDTPEAMIKRADDRLYAAKAKRKADEKAAAVDQATAAESVTPAKNSESPSDKPRDSRQTAPAEPVRRSGRLPKELPVFLIGSDLSGKSFWEQTNTIDLSQHGATVVSRHKLGVEQEMLIRRLDTEQETEVRVARVFGSESETHIYGLEFVSSTADIWGIEFPPLAESEKEANYSLFECSRCKAREAIDNGDAPSNGAAADNAILRPCKHCGTATAWTRLSTDEAGASGAEKPQTSPAEGKPQVFAGQDIVLGIR